MPVARIIEIEAAKLQPRLPVVRRGGQVVAQEVDSHLALALALERGGARRHVRIDGGLGVEASRRGARKSRHAAATDPAAQGAVLSRDMRILRAESILRMSAERW